MHNNNDIHVVIFIATPHRGQSPSQTPERNKHNGRAMKLQYNALVATVNAIQSIVKRRGTRRDSDYRIRPANNSHPMDQLLYFAAQNRYFYSYTSVVIISTTTPQLQLYKKRRSNSGVIVIVSSSYVPVQQQPQRRISTTTPQQQQRHHRRHRHLSASANKSIASRIVNDIHCTVYSYSSTKNTEAQTL